MVSFIGLVLLFFLVWFYSHNTSSILCWYRLHISVCFNVAATIVSEIEVLSNQAELCMGMMQHP